MFQRTPRIATALAALAVATLSAGCATRHAVDTTRILDMPFEKVWSATLATVSAYVGPVESTTKEAEGGVIITRYGIPEQTWMNCDYGDHSDPGRSKFDIVVKPVSLTRTSVFINSFYDFRTRRNGRSACYSTGVFEKRLFGALEEHLKTQ